MTRLLLLAVLLLAACTAQESPERFVPKATQDFAQGYLALFPKGDLDAAEARTDPKQRGPELRVMLQQAADFIPRDKPLDVRLVGAHTVGQGASARTTLLFQYRYPGKWMLASLDVEQAGGTLFVTGMDVKPLTDSLDRINRFTLTGKAAPHYMALGLAVLVAGIAALALWRLVRAGGTRRRWFLLPLVPLGAGQLSMDWTSGDQIWSALHVALLPVGFLKTGPYGPAVVLVSFPIGAIAVLLILRFVLRPRPAP